MLIKNIWIHLHGLLILCVSVCNVVHACMCVPIRKSVIILFGLLYHNEVDRKEYQVLYY